MHFVLSHRADKGGVKSPLRAAHRAAMQVSKHVQAAVAYVSNVSNPVIRDCMEKGLRLEVWSRHDAGLATSLPVLRWANQEMKTKANLTWRLVASFYHPKVIWWRGYGVYVGSGNLTDAAWNSNIEAGVVLLESELDAADLRQPLEDFFADVHEESIPLDDTVCAEAEKLMERHIEMERLRRELAAQFKKSETGRKLSSDSLSDITRKPAADRRRTTFLNEWSETLNYLHLVQAKLNEPGNRPAWVPADVSPGIHTDQFLHAYYYSKVREGRSFPVEQHHRENQANPEHALRAAVQWWRETPNAPSSEEKVFNEWVPVHRELLVPERLDRMTSAEFVRVMRRVHAANNYAKRQRPEDVFDEEELTADPATEVKLDHYFAQLYSERNLLNWSPPRLLKHLFFGGPVASVPARLYECLQSPHKIAGLDWSTLGELVGWALPDTYPPRNDRTNKALRALGWNVQVRNPNREISSGE